MADTHARETQEALIAVLSTAASMGIDIDLLCHLAAEELESDGVRLETQPFVPGAIYQLGVCMNYVVEAS